jgi:hypothetical protein
MHDYDGQRICGVADHIGNVTCQWPMRDVTVFAAGQAGQVSLADAMELALPLWNRVCGVNLQMSTNARTANIVVQVGRIDGPGNVLAQNELPCGFTAHRMRQLQGLYDGSEAFVIADNPPAGKIDLVRVCCHEIGHGIGIGHINDGNLMAPTYSSRVAGPQNGDIVEARARYGQPSPITPIPLPNPVNPAPALPGLPPGLDVGTIFSTLLTLGVELFRAMPAEQRQRLIAWLWTQLLPAEQKLLAEALRLDPDSTDLLGPNE